jgi:hypothetical protein
VYVKELPVPRIKAVGRRRRGWSYAAWFGRHRGSVCGVVDKVGRVCGDGCGGVVQRVTATAVLSLPKLTDLSDLDRGDSECAWLLDSIQKTTTGSS